MSSCAVLEDTRSFLVSTDEISEGHYAFRPWTEAYTMRIPVDAKLSHKSLGVHYEVNCSGWTML
ncbi:hypothetical protein [Sporosarcina sp. NPDC096371]|uniref:hypothetical protein n=1 Tax=Sporosarcina sp. NPDC096371 TaxID=3364530 RepID=UPI0038208AA3